MSATVDIHTKTVEQVVSVAIQSVTTRDDTSSYGSKAAKKRDFGDDTKEDVAPAQSSASKIKKEEKTKEYVFVL